MKFAAPGNKKAYYNQLLLKKYIKTNMSQPANFRELIFFTEICILNTTNEIFVLKKSVEIVHVIIWDLIEQLSFYSLFLDYNEYHMIILTFYSTTIMI